MEQQIVSEMPMQFSMFTVDLLVIVFFADGELQCKMHVSREGKLNEFLNVKKGTNITFTLLYHAQQNLMT